MVNSFQLQKLWLIPALTLVGVAASVGCRNAAYSELYVENMAAEIRDLEDQLYEYDNEYHVLEQQLQALRAENQQLRQSPVSTPTAQPGFLPKASDTNTPRELAPRTAVPEPRNSSGMPNTSNSPKSAPVESILEPPGMTGRSPEQKQQEESLPTLPSKQSTEEISPDMLDVPTIIPGTPKPPPLPVSKDFTSGESKPARNEMELNLSRIEFPAQFASGPAQAQLKLAAEKPSDMRIVEIAFHPTLSRAANFDDEPDDDGLYLVIQPKNVEGQMVPTPASLDIAVLDPSRDEQAARIGRWTYSAAEVKTKLQPLGSNQGIHLTLPWNGPDPGADRVIVFIRYTFPDGRQVVNDKTIFVSTPGSLKTVWVPRSFDGSPVVTASYGQEELATPPTKVIRAPGLSDEPAPPPADSAH